MTEDEKFMGFPIQWWSMTREELEKAVPDGAYHIKGVPWLIMTGKGGVINHILAIREKIVKQENNGKK